MPGAGRWHDQRDIRPSKRERLAADYPFESAQESAEFIDHVPLADDVRADICFNNAATLLGVAAG